MAPILPDEDKNMTDLEIQIKLFELQMKYNEALRDTFKGISDSLKKSTDNFRRKI